MMFNYISSIDNLLGAWQNFIRGKKNKPDVQLFNFHLSDEIISLHQDLMNENYKHGGYQTFQVNDSKPRTIHKASVRDRVLHNAIYRILYPYFDKFFIYDSYSCRLNKGTQKAISRFSEFSRKSSNNFSKTTWVLQCDIKKFFASIDQEILLQILGSKINDKKAMELLREIIESFHSNFGIGKGLPLGNLTSQLLSNIYLNELDIFIKKELKQKFYIRYADDFIIISDNYTDLVEMVPKIKSFLEIKLKLLVKFNKIKTLNSGIDFLGWINFEKHRILRTSTKHRMFKNIKKTKNNSPRRGILLISYSGLLKWGNGYKLSKRIKNIV